MNISEGSLWLIIGLVGLGTFALRSSFIMLFKEGNQPQWLSRALRYVAPAMLATILTSSLLTSRENLSAELSQNRFIAVTVAALVAWRSKSLLWTILTGMVLLWLLNF